MSPNQISIKKVFVNNEDRAEIGWSDLLCSHLLKPVEVDHEFEFRWHRMTTAFLKQWIHSMHYLHCMDFQFQPWYDILSWQAVENWIQLLGGQIFLLQTLNWLFQSIKFSIKLKLLGEEIFLEELGILYSYCDSLTHL